MQEGPIQLRTNTSIRFLPSHRVTPNLATAETPFFLVYGRDPNLPLHHHLQPMQQFLGDPDSGINNLEAHRLTLAIAKKTLDENCFKTAQKTMDRQPPSFKIGDKVYFKTNNQASGTSSGDQVTELSRLSTTDTSCTWKTK